MPTVVYTILTCARADVHAPTRLALYASEADAAAAVTRWLALNGRDGDGTLADLRECLRRNELARDPDGDVNMILRSRNSDGSLFADNHEFDIAQRAVVRAVYVRGAPHVSADEAAARRHLCTFGRSDPGFPPEQRDALYDAPTADAKLALLREHLGGRLDGLYAEITVTPAGTRTKPARRSHA